MSKRRERCHWTSCRRLGLKSRQPNGRSPSVGRAVACRREPGLASLDQRTIAVHLVIQGRERLLRGRGLYESDAHLGSILRVQIADPSGDFELVLHEDQWKGHVRSGEAAGCDYSVHIC